jgi:predicted nucleic acid binding AN1-type Zn finger protein
MHENSDLATKINEINVELSGNSQRYVNECCESQSDGKIDSFSAGCCKCRGGGCCCHLSLPLDLYSKVKPRGDTCLVD